MGLSRFSPLGRGGAEHLVSRVAMACRTSATQICLQNNHSAVFSLCCQSQVLRLHSKSSQVPLRVSSSHPLHADSQADWYDNEHVPLRLQSEYELL